MKTKSTLGKLLLGFSLCFCLVFIDSCKKGDVGPMGPQGMEGTDGAQGDKGDRGDKGNTGATGPRGTAGAKGDTGATGPRGAIGATGAKGDKGDLGNANVSYTEWKEYTGWSIRAASTEENTVGSQYSNIIIAKEISIVDIDETSAVFVYVKTPGVTGGHSIPATYYASGNGKSGQLTYRYHFDHYWLTIYAVLTEGTWDYPYLASNYMPKLLWRVVIVKGSKKVGFSPAGSVDFSSYQAVQRAYGIND